MLENAHDIHGRENRQASAEAAHLLRFGDAEGNVNTPIQPAQLLTPRRYDDRGNDLWRIVFAMRCNWRCCSSRGRG